MDSPAISYVRRNHAKIVVSYDMGAEILSKLAHAALADGVSLVDLHAEDGVYWISCDRPWLVMGAFEELIAYPALAVNSSRMEILVSAFADWFTVVDASGEVLSHGRRPGLADEIASKLKFRQGLVFGLDPEPSRQLWRARVAPDPDISVAKD